MYIQHLLSVVAFACLVLSVVVRVAMLRRRGIRAMVFGETHKSDFLLIPCILVVLYHVYAPAFGWPVWGVLVRRFWSSRAPGWVGLGLSASALVFLVYTLVSFGSSFRVGIDESEPAGLVTSGAFAISRNPIYVCFLAFFTGLFMVYSNITLAAVLVAFALVIHRQVLREEESLARQYGAEYEAYCKKVRRYL